MGRQKSTAPVLEESLEYGWLSHEESRALPVNRRAFTVVALVGIALAALVIGRIVLLGGVRHSTYVARAEHNVERGSSIAAPRGIIYDRYGSVLAENAPSFAALIDVQAFIKEREVYEAETVDVLTATLGVDRDALYRAIDEHTKSDRSEPIVVYEGLTESQVVALESANLPTIIIREGYKRSYPDGPAVASVLGYTSLATAADLEEHPTWSSNEQVGKQGIEAQYDDQLRGIPGKRVETRDARGIERTESANVEAKPGSSLNLTVDRELQRYVYDRMSQGLRDLGRTKGAAIVLQPQTGEVLSLVNFPSFDGNSFVSSNRSAERKEIIQHPDRPLFNRSIAGEYTPASTIKPLVGVAALTENVVSPDWTIYSPGYLDIPNPYNPSKPTRYVDWRKQGTINVRSAIAQSSNVYFYAVGGGTGNLKGLGISRLHEWWEKFLLGVPTGIDLPGERDGFLPTPEWKEETTGTDWLLGDTYNVAIGQGDLRLTPLQIASYVSAIANGGTIYTPYLHRDKQPVVRSVLSEAKPAIAEVQRGMRMTITSDLGTAKPMQDLPFAVAGKTGSSQISNNTKENAFFVGYAPYENPQIAIVILVEESRHGSLNTVPIAKDIFGWWYENRGEGKQD